MEIRARNSSEALCELLRRISIYGVTRSSRAGEVLEIPEPVIIRYEKPYERLIFFNERDFPTIFVLMEAIWMMAGRNDVKFLTKFNKRMAEYSDDGQVFNGSYGHRWRKAFDKDQLADLIKLLKTNPDTRRAVLQMWDCRLDLHPDESATKDVCCNMMVKFQKRGDVLDMTVFNRSNDIIWGTTCVNAVQFSVLLEYVATSLNMKPGTYWQISDNIHVYKDLYVKYKNLIKYAPDPFRTISTTPYAQSDFNPAKIVTHPESFLKECEIFCDRIESDYRGVLDYNNMFFSDIAHPMVQIHNHWKKKDNPLRFSNTRGAMYSMAQSDWRTACDLWIKLREQKANKTKED